jgi:hypothetical protein
MELGYIYGIVAVCILLTIALRHLKCKPSFCEGGVVTSESEMPSVDRITKKDRSMDDDEKQFKVERTYRKTKKLRDVQVINENGDIIMDRNYHKKMTVEEGSIIKFYKLKTDGVTIRGNVRLHKEEVLTVNTENAPVLSYGVVVDEDLFEVTKEKTVAESNIKDDDKVIEEVEED